MKRSLYIASSLHNKERVISLRNKFEALGITLTYDWTTHGWVEDVNALPAVAQAEAQGVRSAKCILAVMPGRNGTHFELGVAWTLQKPIILLIDDLANHVWASFHRLPEMTIVHSEDEAIKLVSEIITGAASC